MEMYGACYQIFICLTLIATTYGASDNDNISAKDKDAFKLFFVTSDSESHSADEINRLCKVQSASECHPLIYFMKHSSDYFKSNEIYKFQPGTHTPLKNSILRITGVSNLNLRGPHLINQSALIDCNGAPVAFEFKNSSNVVIKDLKFDYCAPAQQRYSDSDSMYHDHGYSVLLFVNNTNIQLSRLSLSRSVDEAFYIKDTIGELRLREVQVTLSNTAGREITSAGNAIVYHTCSEQVSQLFLEDSIFRNNSNLAQSNLSKCPTPVFSKGGVPRGGGLSIHIGCGNVNVNISNLTMVGNAGGDGGNLELVFYGSYSFARVDIIKSHFECGYGLEGGGMHIIIFPKTEVTTVATPSVNLGLQYSKQSKVFLTVIDTTFLRNEAVYAGAGVYIKQEQGLRMQTQLGIVFSNSVFIHNTVCKTGFGGIAFHSINYHTTGYYHHETPQFTLVLDNCKFFHNHARDHGHMHRSGPGTGVVFTKSNEYFELKNSTIYKNNSTGVLAVSSNILVSGVINITNNTEGSSGGGMLLCQNAIIYFNADTMVTIASNSVQHVGGGICVETECAQSKPPCFFQLGYEPLVNHSLMDTIKVNIFNNSAQFAGENLFGGSIDYCYMIDNPRHKAEHSTIVFSKLFAIINNTVNPLSITSPPLRVCLCDDNGPLCNKKFPPNSSQINHHVFRGERFKVNVTIVGQQNGLVPGTVHAWLKDIPLDNVNNFDKGQKLQKIGTKNRTRCNTLEYTIRTTSEHSVVTLQLGVQPSGDVGGFELLHQYKRLEINVTLKDCPIGFIQVDGSCMCNRLLSIRRVTCSIKQQIITDVHPGWIGFVDNSLVYQSYCPYDYCQKLNIKIHANETSLDEDKQCAPKRTGIMCGKCKDGFSMVFGTYECEYCSNYWLLILPLYAVLGVIIVLMLTVLDLTISEGTFGGLIFYCNIVRSNFSMFFQGANIPYLTDTLKLFISVFNLETGRSICLFNGMDAYVRNWLHFGFPLYLWFLTGVMICLSRRYSWIARRNAVKVLATLIMLSYTQNLLTAIDALHVAFLYKEYGPHERRWLGDGSLTYFEGKHVPLALFALLFCVLLLPFVFVLFFIQCLQKVTHCRLFSWVTRLKPLFDAYTGPFNANARFWTGLLLIIRIIILIISAYNSGGNPNNTLGVILLISVLLLATSHVLPAGLYGQHCLNILEGWFLFNLALLSASMKYRHYGVESPTIASHLLIGLAFLTAIGIVVYHISKVKAFKKIMSFFYKCCCHCKRQRESHHLQQSLDWNSDEHRYQVENFPKFVAVAEDREPLLASS